MTESPSIEALFERKSPEVKTLYYHLLDALRQFGDFNEVPKSSYILLKKASAFVAIYPRKSHFNLEFIVNYLISDPRLKKELVLSPHRIAYTLKIEQHSDIDEQVLAWLKDAYESCK